MTTQVATHDDAPVVLCWASIRASDRSQADTTLPIDTPDDTRCPACGSSDTGIIDFGPGAQTFPTGNGGAAEPKSIVLAVDCECGGEFEQEIPVA